MLSSYQVPFKHRDLTFFINYCSFNFCINNIKLDFLIELRLVIVNNVCCVHFVSQYSQVLSALIPCVMET